MAQGPRAVLVRFTVFFASLLSCPDEPLAGWINPTITLSSQGDPVIVEAVPCRAAATRTRGPGVALLASRFCFPSAWMGECFLRERKALALTLECGNPVPVAVTRRSLCDLAPGLGTSDAKSISERAV